MPSSARFALAVFLSCAGTLAGAWYGLTLQGWTGADNLLGVLWPYAAGATAGCLAAGLATRYLLKHARLERRFALALAVHVVLALGTIMAIYALQYRLYFAQWHSATFTKHWFVELAFTSFGSFYLFFSTGLVLLAPWAILCWIASACLLAQPLKAAPHGARRTAQNPPAN